MGMSENDGVFGTPQEISQEEAEAFGKCKQLGEKLIAEGNLHVGLKDELDRHKQVMDRVNELECKINMVLKHFNIVKIIG